MKYNWFIILFSIHATGLQLNQHSIYNELSWPIKLKLIKDLPTKPERRVGFAAYRMGDEATTADDKQDDNNIKMKLFRLMYETIRDSDVKVKRAEVVRKYYANTTSFKLGYVMGEITDRFNVMSDIALTLARLHQEWKPMEHINAYEQIANKAVELSHLADAAANLAKKGNLTIRKRQQ